MVIPDTCGNFKVDTRDGTMVIAAREAALLMVAACPISYSLFYNLTTDHRVDLGVTALTIIL